MAIRRNEAGIVTLIRVGVSHRTSPLALRERCAVSSAELPRVVEQARHACEVAELAILSTCNRVELYAASLEPAQAIDRLTEFLVARSQLPPAAFSSSVYTMTGRAVATHLFRVTAGLDSMVLGESEITAQVKHAYLLAHAAGATGPWLNRLFQKTLHCAKLIRSQTGIAQGTASIGSVVVTLARQCFGADLSARQVLLWGAGKAAEATARHLIKHGVGKLWIVNRTTARAQGLASLCRGGWLSWEQARQHLSSADIAIVCTQAPHYVLERRDLEPLLRQRRGRMLCLVDLAVPRNVEPTVSRCSGVRLYNIDDLQRIAQDTLAQRSQELARCETLIAQQTAHFMQRMTPYQQPLEEAICGFNGEQFWL